ncbi:MAG: hypothetical protein CME71_12230 [Halobacteriovorax sp.]|nr:hypothetical protein [Halobacteriovorax sp.]
MNIALVTSEVTYIPHNYDNLILPLLKLGSVKLLIELENRSLALFLKAAGLRVLGAKRVSYHLARNNFCTSSKLRELACKEQAKTSKKIKTMNSEQALTLMSEHHIDLIINLRTRCIYKREILESTRLGCINVHHGILPLYRGTMCDLYALSEGRAAGFSVHKMERKVDAGEIFRIQEVSNDYKNYADYLALTNQFELKVLTDLIEEIESLDALPKGLANTSKAKPIYTKNPDKKTIAKMLEKGMLL